MPKLGSDRLGQLTRQRIPEKEICEPSRVATTTGVFVGCEVLFLIYGSNGLRGVSCTVLHALVHERVSYKIREPWFVTINRLRSVWLCMYEFASCQRFVPVRGFEEGERVSCGCIF